MLLCRRRTHQRTSARRRAALVAYP